MEACYNVSNGFSKQIILKGVYEKPKYSKLLDEYVAADSPSFY